MRFKILLEQLYRLWIDTQVDNNRQIGLCESGASQTNDL